ncbi:MAG TPA: hypothetical protein IAD45_03670 [Candidatus Faecimonas intestinavium]|nr:hypothetical protein [Candidatus Faecimonas intestinavium]
MQGIINYLFENFFNILLVIGGLGAYIVYFRECAARKRDAAALIVTQIEELKDKLLIINNISTGNSVNQKAFYETIDIITDNQWEKYKHMFINEIDSYSFKTINSFYESILSIKDQLLFVKQLQHQQYHNIQGMLDTNCNSFILDGMNMLISSPSLTDLKKIISNKETDKDSESNQNGNFSELVDYLIKANPNFDINQFWKIYNSKKEWLKSIVNESPYIQYVPTQVAETLNKEITNINSIEIIGCEGFRNLKKIAKIK